MSFHRIADKAEVSVDFPNKAYIGSFSRHSQFDAHADADNAVISLVRPGEDRREAVVHLHYGFSRTSSASWRVRRLRVSGSTTSIAPNSVLQPSYLPPRSNHGSRSERRRRGNMFQKPSCSLLVVSVLACFAIRPVHADAARGAQIAQQWCANCHMIGGNTAGAVQQGPPSFRTLSPTSHGADRR